MLTSYASPPTLLSNGRPSPTIVSPRLMVADAFSENIVPPVKILEAPGSGALDKTAWECMKSSLF
jgi:hypothetical protein